MEKNPFFTQSVTEWQKRLEASGLGEPPPNGNLFLAWTLPAVAGNEHQVMELVTASAQPLHLSERRLARLQLAVSEAARNAIEHGNQGHANGVITLQVQISPTALVVRLRDQGTRSRIANPSDLATKLEAPQTGRGWGLYLIKHLVDGWHFRNEAHGHTIDLLMDCTREDHLAKEGFCPSSRVSSFKQIKE